MSLSAAASALAPNPKAEKLCEQGHVLLSKKRNKEARDCFAKAVELTQCNDKVYTFALAQSELLTFNDIAPIVGVLAVLTPFDLITFQASRGEHSGKCRKKRKRKRKRASCLLSFSYIFSLLNTQI